jgi:hypothetical protein
MNMVIDQGTLHHFKQAQIAYEDAMREAATLRRNRDEALLELRQDATLRELVAATGLSLGRVQQIVNRAKRS